MGMLFYDKNLFTNITAFHLLLMAGLIFYTQCKISLPLFVFFILCFVTGFVAELIGTSTGVLFGNYKYGTALGISYKQVPLIIGVNWFITMYCCGVSVNMFFNYLAEKVPQAAGSKSKRLKVFSLIMDAAMLAVLFDWVLEPAAIKLGYWKWLGEGNIPFFNYVCWYLLSALLLSFFQLLSFDKENKFAVNLLLIQLMFFLLVRTFL